jgi:hypothetical protein
LPRLSYDGYYYCNYPGTPDHLRRKSMSQNLSAERQTTANGSGTAENPTVQVALRLRASDHSDRAIVSNVSTVHAASGLVFIDFGFVEQQAIDEVTRAVRAGTQASANIDGRLECRIAMGLGDIAQLSRQLQQVLAAVHQQTAVRPEMGSAITPGPDTSLQ